MPYLTAPDAQETKLTYRYFAELARACHQLGKLELAIHQIS